MNSSNREWTWKWIMNFRWGHSSGWHLDLSWVRSWADSIFRLCLDFQPTETEICMAFSCQICGNMLHSNRKIFSKWPFCFVYVLDLCKLSLHLKFSYFTNASIDFFLYGETLSSTTSVPPVNRFSKWSFQQLQLITGKVSKVWLKMLKTKWRI